MSSLATLTVEPHGPQNGTISPLGALGRMCTTFCTFMASHPCLPFCILHMLTSPIFPTEVRRIYGICCNCWVRHYITHPSPYVAPPLNLPLPIFEASTANLVEIDKYQGPPPLSHRSIGRDDNFPRKQTHFNTRQRKKWPLISSHDRPVPLTAIPLKLTHIEWNPPSIRHHIVNMSAIATFHV